MPLLDPTGFLWIAGLFAMLAVLPGWMLTAPAERLTPASNGLVRLILSGVVGYTLYTLVADAAVKRLGASAWAFLLVPLAFAFLPAALGFDKRSKKRREKPPMRLEAAGGQALLALAFALIVVLQAAPFQLGDKVYWGTPEMDWRSRLPTITAIARDGLPAANPFYNPTGENKLFFYYGSFLMPAGVVRCLNLDPITVLFSFVFMLAFATAVFTQALGTAFVGERLGGWVAGGLLFVTGLDLLPVLYLHFQGSPPPSIEWWNPAQVTSLTAFPVWVPHHTAATLEVLAAHVLLWQSDVGEFSIASRWRTIVAPAVALGGAAISSTYVGLLGFVSVTLHALFSVFWSRRPPRTLLFPGLVVIVGGLSAVPFYADLARIDRYKGPSIEPIVRPFPSDGELAQSLTDVLHLSRPADRPAPAALFVVRVLGLLPQYLVEFGIFFLGALYWLRSARGCETPVSLFSRLAVMCWCGVGIGSLFVSVRTWNCDLNWRILHPVQIALTAATAGFWVSFWRGRPKRIDAFFVLLFVGLGAAGSLYDWTRTRVDYLLLHPEYSTLAGRAERLSADLNARLPWSTRIQFDPDANPFWILHLRSTVVLSDYNFNVFVYGVDQEEVQRTIPEVQKIFTPKTGAEERLAILRRLKIDCLLLERENEFFTRPLDEFLPAGSALVEKQWKDCTVILLRRTR